MIFTKTGFSVFTLGAIAQLSSPNSRTRGQHISSSDRCLTNSSPNLIMRTLICKKPHFRFRPNLPTSNFFFSQTHKNHHGFLRIHPKKFHYTMKPLILCSAAAPQSLSYGGWNDSQLTGDSVNSGESNQFYNFLSSLGIGDKKYVFVYLFGFVCALAISRVKISTIMVFPASAIVFALGFSVGLVKGGHSKELRLNVNRQKVVDDTFRGFIEKLRNLGDNLKGYNADVLNLKNGIKRSIESNHVTVSDLEGYVAVIQSVDISLRSTIDLVESCIQSILGGNLENEGGSDHDSGRRKKKSGDNGLNFSRYFDGLFGRKFDGPKPGKVESMDVEERKNKKQANILAAAPVEKENSNSALNGDLEKKSASVLDNPFDSTVRARNRAENFVDGTGMENIAVENEKRNVTETNDTAKAVFDQTIYSYRNKTSKFVNNQQVCLDDYQDDVETMSSHNSSYNSVDVSISMNHSAASFGHQQKRETLKRNYSYLENTEEDQQEYHKYSYTKGTFGSKKRPSFANQESAQDNVFGNDLEFNRYLSEANNLLKEAKGCLTKQVDDGRTEHALRKSATLLSKAIDMRPMSLLAVGQLGNTYLLHGELKLRMSRELRSLLVRTDPFSDEEWGKILNRFDDQLGNKDKITSALVNVCEECEELLIKAGRKYKLALSIDGNDMRALYNWGLALTFRAQLIADIGPSAARDADKVFLAAIDKFDAMMSKSNAYAPDALFRWGAALQQRSRLRPSRSREKVKLLQQARRLYEDALHMDSGNRPVREALSSCISELDYWDF